MLVVCVSRCCCPGPTPGRLNLAEKLKAPWRRGKRPDPSQAAAREASRLELEEGANAPLGFTVKMMLIGLTGEFGESGVCGGRCGDGQARDKALVSSGAHAQAGEKRCSRE